MSKEQWLTPYNTHTTKSKKTDILLINVPSSFQQGIIPDDDEPPFGLLRIVVTSKKDGFSPNILDAHRGKLNPSEIDDFLYGLKPKFVGINPTSVNIPEAQEIAEMAAIRGIPIIIGGVHATLSPQQAFKDFPTAYAIVRGPGEYPTIHILEGKQTNVPGVYFKEDNNSNRQDYAYPYPINQIPPINYAIWVPNPLTEREIETPQGKKTVIREISLFESYGCPFACTYCSTPVLIGRGQGRKTYSKPSAEKIMQDVKLAMETGVLSSGLCKLITYPLEKIRKPPHRLLSHSIFPKVFLTLPHITQNH